MKVAVFGAGALGSLVGGLLSAHNQVTLICREKHAEAIRKAGLSVSGLVTQVFHPAAEIQPERVGKQDVVFITVKAYDTSAALQSIKPMLKEDTIIISMQNGLNNLDLVTEEFGDRSVIALTSLGSTFLEPGKILFAGKGETILGSKVAERSTLLQIKSLLEEAGIAVRLTDKIESELWMKATINACINPITALTQEPNGCIAQDPQLRELAKDLCAEAATAAAANGISLPVSDPFAKVMEVAYLTSQNKSSMLQDMEAGRRTEIDEITGEIIRRGEKKGVHLPRHLVLWALLYHLSYFSPRAGI